MNTMVEFLNLKVFCPRRPLRFRRLCKSGKKAGALRNQSRAPPTMSPHLSRRSFLKSVGLTGLAAANNLLAVASKLYSRNAGFLSANSFRK
ncbi:twin-arginine translocation signal domain-containing protein [Aeromonas sp. 600584]|uniref:twin-arginine translocation signal domain-containing protein n=1 Tax=Aeromonas sp. 600584 TaxID=2712030 RepID=UPI003B9E14C7